MPKKCIAKGVCAQAANEIKGRPGSQISMKAMDARAVGEADTQIGLRIRERRKELGYSQAYVADIVGISFQQLQKYEVGDSRVAAAMLIKLAEVLRTEPSSLLPKGKRPEPPAKSTPAEDMLALELQHAFSAISSPRSRRLVLEMARNLSDVRSKAGAKPKRASKKS